MNYPEKILKYFDNPKYAGTLTLEAGILTSSVESIASQNFINVFLRINKLNVITEGKYLVKGCPYTVAACEIGIQMVLNKSIQEISNSFNYLDIVNELQLPERKIYCAIQVEDVIKNAIYG